MKSLIKINKYISNKVFLITRWFIESYYPNHKIRYMGVLNEYESVLINLIQTRGIRETLYYMKGCRNIVYRFMSGEKFSTYPRISLDKNGLPKELPLLARLILSQDDIHDKKVALTILSITRVVKLDPISDFNSITSAWDGRIPQEWKAHRSAISRELKLRKKKCSWSRFHTTTKSGPNGQAILTSMTDIHWLKMSVNPLKTEILNNIKLIGGQIISDKIDRLHSLTQIPDLHMYRAIMLQMGLNWPNKRPVIRTISTFGDTEGKTRVIGILDYWSQTVLKPIHDALMGSLRLLEEDCTFSQESFYNKLSDCDIYYSFDLKDATDRLPLEFQKEVISIVLGQEKAEAWAKLLSHLEFASSDRKVTYKYATGQPMGAYSSWPALAITHHAIVRLAARLAGVPARKQYVLLGDDIVIGNKAIAEKYQEIMTILDVPISEAKTHRSENFYEFAKRIVYKKVEITPFPVVAVSETWKRYYLLQNSLETAENRGYSSVTSEELTNSLHRLFCKLGKSGQAQRIIKLYNVFDTMVNKKYAAVDRLGLIAKAISANFSITEEGREKLLEGNFRRALTSVSVNVVAGGLADSEGEVWDLIHKGNDLQTEVIGSEIWDLHPIFWLSQYINEKRIPIMISISKFGNNTEPVEGLFHLIETIPRISTKVLTTRKAHQILGDRAKLIKALLAFINRDIKMLEKYKLRIQYLDNDYEKC